LKTVWQQLTLKILFQFHQVGRAKVIPVTFKILMVLTILIILSNLTTNFISLTFERVNQMGFAKEILVKDLRGLANFTNTQWQIYKIDQDKNKAIANIRKKGLYELKNESSVFLGFDAKEKVIFSTLENNDAVLLDMSALKQGHEGDISGLEGRFVDLTIDSRAYFGILYYNDHWNMYIFRGEDKALYYQESWRNFQFIVLIILVITLISTLTAGYVVRYILRFLNVITNAIMEMTKQQQLSTIQLTGATNDDVTYLGMSFNALSHTMDRLVTIFKKFADRDIVTKAYKEKQIRLEGEKQELTMLFTDIQGYTAMTETLGTDIIKILNVQYGHAIEKIYDNQGAIASIIGDALLAVFGVMASEKNKSYSALVAAYEIIHATDTFRERVKAKKETLIQQHGSLTPEEEKIYQSVLLNVGVGIDSGSVFYGTIGSDLRMTSTVIGDRVNSASRLEGLTRLYRVPVICSDAVLADIQSQEEASSFQFVNIDLVQVLGKGEVIAIYWPIPVSEMNAVMQAAIDLFEQAMSLYFQGSWMEARPLFEQCDLAVAGVFAERTRQQRPDEWDGVWTLTSK
jgi:class 3 adenylate cyclase